MDNHRMLGISQNARRLLADAALLRQHHRLPTALLLLLCLVDALAPRPAGHGRVGERFIAFLDDALIKYSDTGVNLMKVEIPETGELLSFGHILYTYMRNPLVHSGESLDVRSHRLVAHVVLDFEDERLICRSDNPSGRVIIGAKWLIDRLFTILDCVLKNAEQGHAGDAAKPRA